MKHLYLLLTILGCFLFLHSAEAASPSRVGATSTQEVTATSLTWTQAHTTTGTGDNNCLFVIVNVTGSNGDAANVSFGNASTSLVYAPNGVQISGLNVWYLANPTTQTANVVVNFDTGRTGFLTIEELQDCAQSSPIDVTGQADTASATSLSKSITTTIDEDLIMSSLQIDNNATAYVSDAGQTRVSTLDLAASNNDFANDEKAQASAGAVSMGYSWTNANAADLFVWSIKNVPAAAAAAAVGEDLIIFE